MRMIVFLLSVFLFCSCLGDSQKQDFASLRSIPIRGEHFEEEMISTTACRINVVDSSFVVCDSNHPEALISILDEKTGKLQDGWGVRGNGPGEFQLPIFLGSSKGNDTIYIANFPAKVYAYVKNEQGKYKLVKESRIFLDKKWKGQFPMDLHRMENGYYVMTTLSGGKDFFILLDKDCREVKRFGAHPVKGMTADICDFMPLDGRMTSYGNSFYYATFKFGYIARYDISTGGEVELKWEKYLSEPKASVSEANIQMRSSENLTGFYGLAANEDYLFATYSGIYFRAFIDQNDPSANTPRTLVVFHSDGDIIGKYQLLYKSMSICLSEDNRYLYVCNSQPDVAIERFKVEDILNAE